MQRMQGNPSKSCFNLSVVLLVCGLIGGCSRSFWREQGQEDAYDAVSEKMTDYRWTLPRYGIQPSSNSRFFDPYDPDRPPLPPDDPAAHKYMHWMDGRQGYKGWHEFGQELSVENPDWLSAFGLSNLDGKVVPIDGSGKYPKLDGMSLTDAIELSYIHSRQYQREIEDVYLAALSLTAERFEFGVRYLSGGREPSLDGELVDRGLGAAGPAGNSTSFGLGGNFGIQQLLPSGAQWAVELTNSTLWFFSSGGASSSASNLSFSLVQPLFAGAGRKVVMESLTGSERQLLYSIRDLARYRKQFFTQTVSGNGGFLSLLQQAQVIDNQQFNLSLLNFQIARERAIAVELPSRVTTVLPAMPENVLIPRDLVGKLRYESNSTQLSWRGPMNEAQLQQVIGLVAGLDEDDPSRKMFLEAVERLRKALFLEVREPLDKLPDGFSFPSLLSKDDRMRFDAESRELVWRGPLFNADADEFEGIAARVEEKSPALAKAILRLLEELAPEISSLNLAQLQNQKFSNENRLRSSQRQLNDLYDSFKFQLGLPVDMEVSLDRSLLRPFILIDPELQSIETEIKPFIPKWIRRIDPDSNDIQTYQEAVARLRYLQNRVRNYGFGLLDEDLRDVATIIALNRSGGLPKGMRQIADPQTLNRVNIEVEKDARRLDGIKAASEIQQGLIETLESLAKSDDFDAMLKSFDKPDENGQTDGKISIDELPRLGNAVFQKRSDQNDDGEVDRRELILTLMKSMMLASEDILRVSQSLVVIQVGLRAEKVPLNPLRIPGWDKMPSMEDCVSIGLENRLDLMNQRGRVMDARRQIEVVANRLEAVLDLVADADLNSKDSNPVGFQRGLGSVRAGFRFTAPTDMIAERNAYNRQLVEYQRSRRAFIEAEDSVKLEIRRSYRQLELLRVNIDNDRRAVRLSALEYDQAAEQALRDSRNALSLLNALNRVLNAQNGLIFDWVSFESNRLNIFRDMGIMEIDPRGIWIDDFYQSDQESAGSPTIPPPAPPEGTAIESDDSPQLSRIFQQSR